MKRFLTSKEAADYLGIQEGELQELVNKGKVPVYKIGGIYTRFSVDDLNACRRKISRRGGHKEKSSLTIDRIKDFFYFNDFYVLSGIAIIVILYFIFK